MAVSTHAEENNFSPEFCFNLKYFRADLTAVHLGSQKLNSLCAVWLHPYEKSTSNRTPGGASGRHVSLNPGSALARTNQCLSQWTCLLLRRICARQLQMMPWPDSTSSGVHARKQFMMTNTCSDSWHAFAFMLLFFFCLEQAKWNCHADFWQVYNCLHYTHLTPQLKRKKPQTLSHNKTRQGFFFYSSERCRWWLWKVHSHIGIEKFNLA